MSVLTIKAVGAPSHSRERRQTKARLSFFLQKTLHTRAIAANLTQNRMQLREHGNMGMCRVSEGTIASPEKEKPLLTSSRGQ
jgi:hypothetical protein